LLANPSVVMKNPIILFLCTVCAMASHAQVGIGTTTPNSTLDIQGSLAAKTTISTSTSNTLGSEFVFIYTGGSAATVTLPNAASITGRMYTIKNSGSSTLTVNTTSSEQIDGATTYVMASQYQTISVVSNGTNWNIIGYGIPSGNYWALGGNNVASATNLGTTSAQDLAIITGNTEKMRITSAGEVGIGSDAFDASAPEKLLIDAGATSSYNLIGAYGERDGYLQFNIQNLSTGGQASADIVATASNGTETSNYVNLGINGGSYNNAGSSILSGPNNAYLYSAARNFVIGNSSSSYNLMFFTGGTNTSNERMRITNDGRVGIGTSNPSASHKLEVSGNALASAWQTTSDKRLKTDIKETHYGLKEVMRLKPVSWRWKDQSLDKRLQLGLIAQDARKTIPEIVSGNEQKETLSINYTELIPVLINAIKEQQQQIEELKEEMKALKHK
jgi:hypothetical protein